MRRFMATVALWVCLVLPAAANPYAVVRIPSHGISGVVVATGPGGSRILTCAHGFSPLRNPIPKSRHPISKKLLEKKMTFQMYDPSPGAAKKVRYKILAVDGQRDLCLIWISVQLPYIAKIGNYSGGNVLSCGFDFMKAAKFSRTTVTRVSPLWIETRSSPRPGRSGGPLLNEKGEVIGTCVGFEGRGGLYTSHHSIAQFIIVSKDRQPLFDPSQTQTPAAPPQIFEQRSVPQYYRSFQRNSRQQAPC